MVDMTLKTSKQRSRSFILVPIDFSYIYIRLRLSTVSFALGRTVYPVATIHHIADDDNRRRLTTDATLYHSATVMVRSAKNVKRKNWNHQTPV